MVPDPDISTELIAAVAVCKSVGITRSRLDDYVEKGLAAAPVRRGRGVGGGRGQDAGWTANAVKGLQLVTGHRASGTAIAELCNVPVGLWLYFGDEYASVKQVRRALSTWRDRIETRSRSVERARRAASDTHNKLAPPGSPKDVRRWKREALIDTAAQQARDGTFDTSQIETAIADVLNIRDDGRTYAGVSECPATPQTLTFGMRARRTGLERLATFTDEDFTWARHIHLSGIQQYAKSQPQLADSAGNEHIYDALSIEKMLNRACADVVQALGILALRPECAKWTAARAPVSGPVIRLRAETITSPIYPA